MGEAKEHWNKHGKIKKWKRRCGREEEGVTGVEGKKRKANVEKLVRKCLSLENQNFQMLRTRKV